MENKIVSDMYKGWRILGIHSDETACTYYRVTQPLKYLQMHGADVRLTSILNPSLISEYDLIIAPRQTAAATRSILRWAQWHNTVVIGECDDDLDNITSDNPAIKVFNKGGDALNNLNKTFEMAHGLTVTTPELKKWYERLNTNIAVIDNYIDFSLRSWGAEVRWLDGMGTDVRLTNPSKPEHRQGKFVIGYSGGTSHLADLVIVGPTLSRFMNDHKDSMLVLYTHTDMANWFIETFKIPKDQVELVDPVPFMEHPAGLWGVDVYLAPLQINQFNMCKSSLKLKESLAAGAAIIGTSIAPYSRFHNEYPDLVTLVGQGPNCTPTWYEALQNLKDDPAGLEKIQITGRSKMYTEQSLEMNYHKFPLAWEAIFENYTKNKMGKPEFKKLNEYLTYGKLKSNDPCPIGSGKYKDNYPGAFG